MEKGTEKTIVVFRKFKDGGDILALFPTFINYPNGDCESYQHVGQHGAADYSHCMKASVAATFEEYSALQRELESIGYNLDIKKRFRRGKVENTVTNETIPEVNCRELYEN